MTAQAKPTPPWGHVQLRCDWERPSVIAKEMLALAGRWQVELGTDPFDPDWERIFALERMSAAMIWTARSIPGALVGYMFVTFGRGLFTSQRVARIEAGYLAPEWRAGMTGLRYIKSTLDAIDRLGAFSIEWETNDHYEPDARWTQPPCRSIKEARAYSSRHGDEAMSGGSAAGTSSYQTPTALYGAENNIFQPLPYSNTGAAANNAYSGIGNINQNPAASLGALQQSGGGLLTQGGNAINAGNAAGAYAPQALQTAFDPLSKQYAQQFAQNQNQANAVNAMSGVANTPYGAGLTQQADTNFNLGWQQQELQRQQTGAQTAQTLLGAQNAGLGAGGNAIMQGGQALQQPLQMNQQAVQQAIQDYLAYLQANTSNAAAYTGAANASTNAASNATGVLNQGTQQNNAATAGLGSLAGTLGGYLIAGV